MHMLVSLFALIVLSSDFLETLTLKRIEKSVRYTKKGIVQDFIYTMPFGFRRAHHSMRDLLLFRIMIIQIPAQVFRHGLIQHIPTI